MIRTRTFLLAAGLCLAALPALAGPYPGHPTTTPDINAHDLSRRATRRSPHDAFEGRGPGTRAGRAASQWIADEMKRIGLKPGNHGSYFQTVPAVNITLDASKSSLVFKTAKGTIDPKFPDEDVYWTPQFKSTPRLGEGFAARLRRLWRRRAGISLERLCRHRCEGEDGRHPRQRSGLRERRSEVLQGQGHDLLWSLVLQI